MNISIYDLPFDWAQGGESSDAAQDRLHVEPFENYSGTKESKLAKPKDLPQRVGMHLVTRLNEDPDWVWSLKAALRPKGDEKNANEIRIFNPADAARKGVVIANFNSLDAHPDMILFFGSFNMKTGSVQIEKTVKKVA